MYVLKPETASVKNSIEIVMVRKGENNMVKTLARLKVFCDVIEMIAGIVKALVWGEPYRLYFS